ncbi:retrovirus-related pol polyprotein from transposon TNT 1-94 [Tanacetum coccineum]
MERGFLDYSDKKKKEGGAKEDDGVIPILGDLAKRVKNIEGKTTMPKGILKKAVRNVSSDTHEVVMPLNDVGSGSKVNFEAVAATNIDKPSSSSGAQSTIGSEQEVFTSNDGPKTGNSFVSLLRSNEANNKVHFRTLVNEERVESVDCVLPKAAAAKVKSRYENSIVGFFVGKDPSFPVVQQYVSNTWRKFGFDKITRNDDGVYLFKFASKSGIDQVLEKGPWMIRKSHIILNKWSPSMSLKKCEVTKVPVWVKFSMCVESWGRISFARALIEISAHSILKKEVTIAISDDEGDGYTKEVNRVGVRIEPPLCVNCQSFGDMKPNKVLNMFIQKEKEGRLIRGPFFGGLRLNKPNSKVIWQQKKGVDAKGGSNSTSPSVSTNDNDKANLRNKEVKRSSLGVETWE